MPRLKPKKTAADKAYDAVEAVTKEFAKLNAKFKNSPFKNQYEARINTLKEDFIRLSGEVGIRIVAIDADQSADRQYLPIEADPDHLYEINKRHFILNPQTTTKDALAKAKELKSFAEKLDKEAAVFSSQVDKAHDGEAIRKQLEEQYKKNLKDNTNLVLVEANNKITEIINALPRVNSEERKYLRQMATMIMITSEKELRKISKGKQGDVPAQTTRRDALGAALTVVKDKLENDLDDGAKVFTPTEDGTDHRHKLNRARTLKYDADRGHFTSTALITNPEFDNVEYIHQNYEAFKAEVERNTAFLKSLYLTRSLTEEQQRQLAQEALRAEMLLARLTLYQTYLLSYPSSPTKVTRIGDDNVSGQLNDLKTNLTTAQGLKDTNQIGLLVTTSEPVQRGEAASLMVAVDNKLRDNPAARTATEGGIRGVATALEAKASFDGTETAMINRIKLPISTTESKEFVTVQMVIGNQFCSNFRYSRAEVEMLSSEDRFALAIAEAHNFLKARTDTTAPLRISGDWPEDFVKTMVDYLALNKALIVNDCTDGVDSKGKIKKSKVSATSLGAGQRRRNLASKLDDSDLRQKIFGTDAPLGFQESTQKSMQKKAKAEVSHIQGFVDPAPPRRP